MRKISQEKKQHREGVIERLFRKRSIIRKFCDKTFGRRYEDRIVLYEALRRKKTKYGRFTNLEIDRILLDWDVKPTQHSNTSYKGLKTRRGLAAHMGNSANMNYTSQLLDNEAEETYSEFFGELSESPKGSLFEKKRPILRRATDSLQSIAETHAQIVRKPKPAY